MTRYDIAPVTLGDLVADLPGNAAVVGDPATVVHGITQDSRSVQPGDLYCCVVGQSHDGHDFVPEARSNGSGAVLSHRGALSGDEDVARIEVDDVRSILGLVAERVFGSPAAHLRLVGVTGTNGKTSTVEILGSILSASGSRVRTMGTLTGTRTTPEAIDLHASLALARADGMDTVVMEVSSHALDQGRVNGVCFDVAVFTNLGRDHLDYHGTMEAYFAAKARLFAPDRARVAVVNLDDTHGRLLADAARIPTRGYSRSDASDVSVGVDRISCHWRGVTLTLGVGGDFMVDNVLAAASAAEALGIPVAAVAAGCATVQPVRGRFEALVSDGGFSVVVDYAHTPEALERLLVSARALVTGRVILVFGCGGGRDAGKRPLMGRIATEFADEVIVTSDNPRHESPGSIIAEIVAGATGGSIRTEQDRARAIERAISMADRGDVVVVAGKGHEAYQELADRTIDFDDVEVARSCMKRRDITETSGAGRGASRG